ncbi:MAG TPA: choice-of-anchor Q domain-containing protein, partial [Puia sp.]|nr:choice-of-anchor Q domain-containing protein [Puia sp.]
LRQMKLPLLILLFAAALILSCQKDSFITSKGAIVSFSSDTLFFDTVFTTAGSVTQSVKIFNGNDQKLRLSDLKLMGGNKSFFSINVDGYPGPEKNDLELEANDSLYIFVVVRIDPTTGNLPFVAQDSIAVTFNGNVRYIQLQAWGQNAHFLRNQKIQGNVVWDNTLPYVIMGGLQVDTNAILTIQQGSRVYFHADAPMLVDGTLQVQGAQPDSMKVMFQSDRLDEPYREFPGSWPGIYFRGASVNNNLQFAVIKNAYQGIVAETPASNAVPKVVLNQCIVDNIYDAGILGAESSIQATNCLISNCGKNIVLGYGGNYQFTHCTVASYSNDYISHTQPVLSVSNYILQGNSPLTAPLNAGFLNCIFWGGNGTVDNEVIVSQQGNTSFSVNFANCLWKVKATPAGVVSSNIIANSDPLFDSVNTFRRHFDFRLKNGSPAIDKGAATMVSNDLDGKPRPVGLPDLGCYEKQ